MQPDRIGPYEVLRLLGSGGMGSVYLALDDDGRTVAIKVIHPHVAADANGLRRMEREAAAMERLRSPYLAEILDTDLQCETPYLVTRYVQGRSLHQIVGGRGPLRGAALHAVAQGLAEALTVIHAAGVVHRDLTPRNVMMADGVPVVIDLGIAQTPDGTRMTHGVIGTPGYVAPEVFEGGRAAPAADVFAWGVTMVFAATGKSCFEGDSLGQVMHKILTQEPDLTDVPDDLIPPIIAALAKDPTHRPTAPNLLPTPPEPTESDAASPVSAGTDDTRRQAPEASNVASPVSASTDDTRREGSVPYVAGPGTPAPGASPVGGGVHDTSRPPASYPAADPALASPAGEGVHDISRPPASYAASPGAAAGAWAPPLGAPAREDLERRYEERQQAFRDALAAGENVFAFGAAGELHRIAMELGDNGKAAWGLRSAGEAMAAQGDHANAAHHYEQARLLAVGAGRRDIEAACLCGLGGCAAAFGDRVRAEQMYELGAHIAFEIANTAIESTCAYELAIAAEERNDLARAEWFYERVRVLAVADADRGDEAYALFGLGTCAAAYDRQRAEALFRDALRAAELAGEDELQQWAVDELLSLAKGRKSRGRRRV